jgi:hypothetical protein
MIVRRALKALSVTAAFAALLFALTTGEATAAESGTYGLESVGASLSTYQAGAHADFTTTFSLKAAESGRSFGATRAITLALPPGLIGNPQGFPRCTGQQFGINPVSSECPIDSQVGSTNILAATGSGAPGPINGEPIYNLVPPEGTVARLGFYALEYPTIIDIRVDPRTYSLIATIRGLSSAVELLEAETTLWGVPASPVHDQLRITPEEAHQNNGPAGGREAGLPEAPFLTNPTSCGVPLSVATTMESYAAELSSLGATMPAITGCSKVRFEPTLTVTPTSTEAASATGIDAELTIPQVETAKGLGTSDLKAASVLLPPGMTINPAAGDGLEACTVEQVGFERDEDAHCPDGSKLGTVEVDVPALEHTLQGSVYQRTPEPGNLFRFWLVADELGVHLKLPAEIKPDPVTGQLTTVFNGLDSLGGNPQVPVSDLKLHIFGGPRAPLSTPSTCGTYSTAYTLTPWSGNPAPTGSTPMQITSGCGKGGFSPTLNAGMVNPEAGGYSPFVFELRRQDGEANLSTVTARLPEGLLGKLGTIPLCEGGAATSGNCDPASQVGTVNVAAGVGSAPLWIPQPGKSPTAVYLGGPYKGAPYSLVIKVPAQAGPFDLGTVITRAAVQVDPTTTQVTVAADPLPQILEGVPVSYRNVYVSINRPEFMVNPTNCNGMQITTSLTAINGAAANPAAGFQAANCAALAFAPKLSLKLSGKMKRTGNPALKAVLTYPKQKSANIGRVQVVLPDTEFIDNAHINNPCTRVQFAAEQCPAKSVLGKARAWSPLLGRPLEGPVYFRSNGGERTLPDLVADLKGQINVVLVGWIDSVKVKHSERTRVRTTFAAVPDAPVSRFVMELSGGKHGLLENNSNLCKTKLQATVKMGGQNGRTSDFMPAVGRTCKAKKK